MDEFINRCAEPNAQSQHKEQEDQIIEQAIRIIEARMQGPEFNVTKPEDAKNYFRLHLRERKAESFMVMYLDNQHGFMGVKEMFRGTIDGASVHPREVVRATLAFNAAALILAHNHPSGIALPSKADERITQRLKSALELIDVRILDHFIVGRDEVYSFAEHGLI